MQNRFVDGDEAATVGTNTVLAKNKKREKKETSTSIINDDSHHQQMLQQNSSSSDHITLRQRNEPAEAQEVI